MAFSVQTSPAESNGARDQDRVGVPGVIRTQPENSWGYFYPTVPTLADELKKAGYDTAIVGKWHLGLESPNTPNERGFDHFHGFLGDMMDSYTDHLRHGNNYMRLNEHVIEPKGHATELFSQWAADYLKSRAEKKDEPYSRLELYHLKNDPGESTKLATKSPEVFKEFSAALAARIQRGGTTCWQKPRSR